MIPLDDCCYTCAGPCQRVVCRDNDPSPGETEFTCADDYDYGQRIAAELDNERRSA